MSEKSGPAHITAQAASGTVLIKLIVFSLCLGILPLTSYFASLKYLWNGNATYAAITAIAAANIVLVLYIISSVMEDRRDNDDAEAKQANVEHKKTR